MPRFKNEESSMKRSPAYVCTIKLQNGEPYITEDVTYVNMVKDSCKRETMQLRKEGVKNERWRWRIRGRKPLPGKGWVSSDRFFRCSTFVPLMDATEADVYMYKARDF